MDGWMMEGVGRGWMMLEGEGTVTIHQGNEWDGMVVGERVIDCQSQHLPPFFIKINRMLDMSHVMTHFILLINKLTIPFHCFISHFTVHAILFSLDPKYSSNVI
jgi:hypothetical protein